MHSPRFGRNTNEIRSPFDSSRRAKGVFRSTLKEAFTLVTIKVYPNQYNQTTIICPNCGKEKSVDASKFIEQFKPVKVKCSCGVDFLVSFEKRKHYRKTVNLLGRCKKLVPLESPQQIVVEDISRTGLRIKFFGPHGLRPGDIVKVEFFLDDANHSPVDLNTEVKRIAETWVGLEYCDLNIPKSLAFYLMP